MSAFSSAAFARKSRAHRNFLIPEGIRAFRECVVPRPIVAQDTCRLFRPRHGRSKSAWLHISSRASEPLPRASNAFVRGFASGSEQPWREKSDGSRKLPQRRVNRRAALPSLRLDASTRRNVDLIHRKELPPEFPYEHRHACLEIQNSSRFSGLGSLQ